MALARKGSQRISIDGTDYRWKVAPNDTSMELVIQRAQGRGARLSVLFSYDDEYVPIPGSSECTRIQRRTITPADARRAILHALSEGWKPMEKGDLRYWMKGGALVRS